LAHTANSTIKTNHTRVTETSSTTTGPSQAPDFKQVRSYLRDISQREALGDFIKAGWSAAELSELARSIYLARGRTYPTATSYQVAVSMGPDNAIAKIILAQLRSPAYEMPPFNRAIPPRPIGIDDPEHPDHTPEVRAAVQEMAWCFKRRRAEREALPSPLPDAPIQRALWKRCFRLLNRHGTLEQALQCEGLLGYSEPQKEID
jgi:hypothetical protein